jgi:23S rRNA (guanine745-N1)-methyltransferase
VLVAFAPRNVAEMHRVLRPDGRLVVLAPAADHLRELLVHTSVGIDAHKRERLDRTFGRCFELERRRRVTDRVHLRADAGAALYRMGPWARHEVTPRPLDNVTIAVELSIYRPRLL